MNIKRKISSVLLLSSLALSSLPAMAVSYDSSYIADQYNTPGTDTRVLPPFANHFCYLSMVEMDKLDTEQNLARCRVTTQNGSWILQATLGNGAGADDADVVCRAVCYNN